MAKAKRKTAKRPKPSRRPRRQSQRDFEMECMEKEAERQVAWGIYAQYVGQQNYNRERARLERNIATSVGSDSSRREAERELAEFHRRNRSLAGTLVVGPPTGNSRAISSDGDVEDFD